MRLVVGQRLWERDRATFRPVYVVLVKRQWAFAGGIRVAAQVDKSGLHRTDDDRGHGYLLTDDQVLAELRREAMRKQIEQARHAIWSAAPETISAVCALLGIECPTPRPDDEILAELT